MFPLSLVCVFVCESMGFSPLPPFPLPLSLTAVRTASISGSVSGDGYGSVSSAGEEEDLGASFKIKCSLCGHRFSFEEIADHSAVCDATYTPAARRGKGKAGGPLTCTYFVCWMASCVLDYQLRAGV